MAADIEPTANTSEKSLKRSHAGAPRDAARKMIKPMRSIAIFGAVGALVAAVAMPAYAASTTPVDATATLQQVAADDSQSLVVASAATASPLDRSTYSATTQEEIDTKKAAEAAAAAAEAAAAAAAASGGGDEGGGGGSINIGDYALVSPGSGEVRYPLPQGSYREGRTTVGPDSGGHEGADMLAPQGTPIYAAAAGVVRASSESYYGYGVGITIDHVIAGQSVSTTYGHMTYGTRQVEVGDTVQAGQLIGAVGSTGSSTAYHLHFEVHVNGSILEPYAWLAANAG